MHQSALQENIHFYLGFALVCIIIICGIALMNNNQNKNK
jgi:hypothetical protein